MFLHNVLMVFCAVLAFKDTEGQCQHGNKTYQMGETWKVKEQCGVHLCMQDGIYNTTTCKPIPDEIPKGMVFYQGEPEMDFPHCCDALLYAPPCCKQVTYNTSLPVCTVENRTVWYDQQYDLPGKCQRHVCKGNNNWEFGECDPVPKEIPDGMILRGEYVNLPFPACCAVLIHPPPAGIP